jgi:hypothetical protein
MAMMMEPNGREEQKYQVPAEADEQQLWTELTASAWGDAINGKQSVFYELYEDTKKNGFGRSKDWWLRLPH